jgi:hypothetical protein
MNRIVICLSVMALTFPIAAVAQSTTQTASLTAPLTARDAQSLMKSASSSGQYKQLASYFRQREATFRAKAADEKTERDRRAQVNAALYQKYPRPVDSAQYLYDSYVSSADSAALQAQHFDQLAAGQTNQGQQLAGASTGKP